MFSGLEHTAIASPDPGKLAQWYVDHLEFRINHTYNGNFFVRAANGGMLEIIPSEGDRAAEGMKAPGIRHLAIWVDDFDAARQRLVDQNVNMVGEPFYAGTNRLSFFTDCDGNLIHLIHREKPLP